MASIYRLRVTWAGTPVVGGGLSTFFLATTPLTFHASVAAFYNAIKGLVPSGVQWTIPNTGDELEDSNGALVDTWTESGGPSTVVSTGTANYVNGVGMRVKWFTDGVHNRRRVVGSTFIVPLLNGLYTSDGTIDNASVATVQTAAAALVSAEPAFCVWSRPRGGPNGVNSKVQSALAVDAVSWLRSRRT